MWPMKPKEIVKFFVLMSPVLQMPALLYIVYRWSEGIWLGVGFMLIWSLVSTIPFARIVMDNAVRHERRDILGGLPEHLREQVLEALG